MGCVYKADKLNDINLKWRCYRRWNVIGKSYYTNTCITSLTSCQYAFGSIYEVTYPLRLRINKSLTRQKILLKKTKTKPKQPTIK